MPTSSRWQFSLLTFFVFTTLVAGVIAVGVWDWFAIPLATAVAGMIGANIERFRAAKRLLPEGAPWGSTLLFSLLIFVAAIVTLVITRILIFLSFEFRITPPPPDDQLAAVLRQQFSEEVVAEAVSAIPAAIIFFLTWPSEAYSRASRGSVLPDQ